MNDWHRLGSVTICLVAGSLLNACATATVRPVVDVRPISITDVATSVSDAFLIGGGGVDWARTVLCPTDNWCALFGFGNKSFTESTDFFVVVEGHANAPSWAQTYGGTHRDTLRTAALASGGGYLLVGTSQSLFFTALKVISPSRPPRPFVVNIDAAGAPRWALTFDSLVGEFFGAALTSDGGHVLVGHNPLAGSGRKSALAALKLSAGGQVLWARAYDFGANAVGMAAVPTADGGIAIAGFTAADDGRFLKTVLMKVDGQGVPLWARLYATEGRNGAYSLTEMADSSLVAAGSADAANGDRGVFVLKVSSAGTSVWAFSFEGLRNGQAMHVIPGHGSDILVAGRMADGPHGGYDGLALLLDTDGAPKASLVLGGPKDDEIMAAARWNAGRYRLVGSTENFGAAFVDVLSVVWSPRVVAAEVLSNLDPKGLTIEETAAPEIARVDLRPTAVQLPLSSIESTKLAVPATNR